MTDVETEPSAVDKAKAAVEGVKALLHAAEGTASGIMSQRDLDNLQNLWSAANVNAQIAQAEALERIAAALEGFEITRMGDVLMGRSTT